MLKVGLTGGIGSGKTLVSQIFSKLGIPVFNADNEAKLILDKDKEVIQQLILEFGSDIYKNEKINRQKLATIIFNDKNALQKVNSITHPKVREYFVKWIGQCKNVPYVIEEAAILFESQVNKEMDFTINVHADELLRINRVVERDNLTIDLVKDRIKNQLTDNERIELADFTIYNDNKRMILPQVLDIHHKLLKKI